MSDLDKFKELYKSLGIVLKPIVTDNSKIVIYLSAGEHNDPDFSTSKFFDGYTGFFSILEFNEKGKFLKQGFYE